MTEVERLRPLTAGRLLAIWRETGETAESELERSLLCNARVLAECCLAGDGRAFSSAEEVLAELTCREMEGLLRRLATGETETPGTGAGAMNPAFDPARFRALREG